MDPVSFILLLLFGVLVIFIIVRIVNAAQRVVDREQGDKQGRLAASVSNAPPQPAPALPPGKPKEVKLGMTPEEVESALGPPQTKADLGEKVLYKYDGMTVEFKAGKVLDVK